MPDCLGFPEGPGGVPPVTDFLSNVFETVAGTLKGFGNYTSVALGMGAVVVIFIVSQIVVFAPPLLIGLGIVKLKGFLDETGIIPKTRRVSKEIFG